MLTLKAPIQLHIAQGLTGNAEAFSQKILGNYNLMGAKVTPKELLFLLTAPPELPEELGGMTTLISQQTQVDNRSVLLEVANHVVNRILLDGTNQFTYQDQVYITTVLNRLGITNVDEFMTQVRQLRTESENTFQLTQLYRSEVERLLRQQSQGIETPRLPLATPERAEEEGRGTSPATAMSLQIFNRLQTAALYETVHDFQHSWSQSQTQLHRNEFRLSEQLHVQQSVALAEWKQQVFQQPQIHLQHHVNQYETGTLLPPPKNQEHVLSQAAVAALLTAVDNTVTQVLHRPQMLQSQWLHLERALWQTAEHTLSRFETYHTQQVYLPTREERSQAAAWMRYTQEVRDYLTLHQHLHPQAASTVAPSLTVTPTGEGMTHLVQTEEGQVYFWQGERLEQLTLEQRGVLLRELLTTQLESSKVFFSEKETVAAIGRAWELLTNLTRVQEQIFSAPQGDQVIHITKAQREHLVQELLTEKDYTQTLRETQRTQLDTHSRENIPGEAHLTQVDQGNMTEIMGDQIALISEALESQLVRELTSSETTTRQVWKALSEATPESALYQTFQRLTEMIHLQKAEITEEAGDEIFHLTEEESTALVREIVSSETALRELRERLDTTQAPAALQQTVEYLTELSAVKYNSFTEENAALLTLITHQQQERLLREVVSSELTTRQMREFLRSAPAETALHQTFQRFEALTHAESVSIMEEEGDTLLHLTEEQGTALLRQVLSTEIQRQELRELISAVPAPTVLHQTLKQLTEFTSVQEKAFTDIFNKNLTQTTALQQEQLLRQLHSAETTIRKESGRDVLARETLLQREHTQEAWERVLEMQQGAVLESSQIPQAAEHKEITLPRRLPVEKEEGASPLPPLELTALEAEQQSPEALAEEVARIDQNNRMILQAVQQEMQKRQTTPAPATLDRQRTMRDSLRALEDPATVLQEFYSHQEASPAPITQLTDREVAILSRADPATRALYEQILLYEKSPEAALAMGRVQPGKLGAFLADIQKVSQESAQVQQLDTIHRLEQQETETTLEDFRTVLEQRRTTTSPAPAEEPPIVHRAAVPEGEEAFPKRSESPSPQMPQMPQMLKPEEAEALKAHLQNVRPQEMPEALPQTLTPQMLETLQVQLDPQIYQEVQLLLERRETVYQREQQVRQQETQAVPERLETLYRLEREERETTLEGLQTILEHHPAVEQTLPPPPPALRIVHKQPAPDLTEELLEQLEQQRTQSVVKTQTNEEITRQSVRHTDLNQVERQVVTQTSEEITQLVNRTLSQQMRTITDQVYRQMEKRLQTERSRRGRF